MNTVAFDYAAKLPVPDLQFLAKFDVVVTGGILGPDQLSILHAGKSRTVLYFWSSALYPESAPPSPTEAEWQKGLETNAKSWLLAPNPVSGGAASSEKGALWYDFGNPELVSALALHIQSLLTSVGYQGVFLDTLGQHSVPPALLSQYKRRHPDIEYDVAQARLISKLREHLGPGGIIFTNQGYRRAEIFLPNVDFDLIENSATQIEANGETRLRPWHDAQTPWESVQVPIENLILPAAQAFPNTQFVHLNYAAGAEQMCKRAVRYSYACAKLVDQISFVAPPHIQTVIRDNVYFDKLGDPISPSYEEDRDAGVAWRRFRNGVVAVNSSSKAYRIRSLGFNLTDPPRGYIFLKNRPIH